MRIQPGLAADEACRNVGLDRPPDPEGKQRRFQYSDNTLHAQRHSDPDKRWVPSLRVALSDSTGCSVLTQSHRVVSAIPDDEGYCPECTSDAV